MESVPDAGPIGPAVATSQAAAERSKTRLPDAQYAELASFFEGTVPRWALAAAKLDFGKALSDLRNGGLNKNNFNAWSNKRIHSAKPAEDLKSKWAEAKKKFKGIPLLEDPKRPKERAFRKAYDEILADSQKLPRNLQEAFKLPKLRKVNPTPKKKTESAPPLAGLLEQLEGLKPLLELLALLKK
jgi:hypothetical protein